MLFFLILVCVEMIGIYFSKGPGEDQVLMIVNITAEYSLVIIVIFLIAKARKINKKVYWDQLHLSLFTAVAGVILCNLLSTFFDKV